MANVQPFYGTTSNCQSGIDLVINGKKQLVRSRIEMILNQLQRRKAINRDVVYGINYDSCRLQGMIFEAENNTYLAGKSRIHLERMQFDLARQHRAEKVSYFKDTARLNSDLTEAILAYQKEAQSEEIIGGMN